MLEIDFLRSIACLSVVLLHSIKYSIGFDVDVESLDTTSYVLVVISGLLAFGTPTFIVISEILLSYSYPYKIPNNFYGKRLKVILIPFVSMAFFYAVVIWYKTPGEIPINFLYNLMGNYHGWFVLTIFQFYLLHHLFTKFFYKHSMSKVLIVTFLINLVYLSFFNLYESSSSNDFISYFWRRGYWIPFIGWLFYFSIAYYLGKNYHKCLYLLKKYKVWIYLLLPFSIGIVIAFNNILPSAEFGSKRFDMVFLTFNVIAIVLLLTSNVKKLPSIVKLISRYSFSIYLLHWFFLLVQFKIFDFTGFDFGHYNILFYFITCIVGSITTSYVINRFRIGKYIVGNTGEKHSSSQT